jgi:hypothetical protein
MATIQTIEDGPRNLVIKVDGTGVETNALIVDVSALTPPCSEVSLLKVTYSLGPSATMQILWKATANVVALTLFGNADNHMNFCQTAGIPNNAGAGKNGDVLLNGGTASTNYTLYLHFLKRHVQMPR